MLKPGMLVRRMVGDQVDEHPDAPLFCAVSELDKISERAEGRIDAVVIRDIVAIISSRRTLERHKPDGCHAEPMQIIEPAHQTLKIADTISVCVHKCCNG